LPGFLNANCLVRVHFARPKNKTCHTGRLHQLCPGPRLGVAISVCHHRPPNVVITTRPIWRCCTRDMAHSPSSGPPAFMHHCNTTTSFGTYRDNQLNGICGMRCHGAPLNADYVAPSIFGLRTSYALTMRSTKRSRRSRSTCLAGSAHRSHGASSTLDGTRTNRIA
jgi:hypothetical protein